MWRCIVTDPHILRLAPDYRITVAPPPLERLIGAAPLIEGIWRTEEEKSGGALFDGDVLALTGATAHEITVCPAKYSTVLASRRDRRVQEMLGMMPLGVTSVLTCPDGILIGRRSPRLAMSPGAWEVMPGGALERPDARGQILQELTEELGLPAGCLTRCEAAALVQLPDHATANILFRLETALSAAAINAAFAASGSDEHTAIAIVPSDGLSGYLSAEGPHGLATASYLRAAGITPAHMPIPTA